MTVDERVNDIMARLMAWIEAGAAKPFQWDGDKCDFVYLDDESLRRFLIAKIVEAGRQDGAEAEREACAKMCEGHANDHRSAPEDSPVQYAASEAETLAHAIRARGNKP